MFTNQLTRISAASPGGRKMPVLVVRPYDRPDADLLADERFVEKIRPKGQMVFDQTPFQGLKVLSRGSALGNKIVRTRHRDPTSEDSAIYVELDFLGDPSDMRVVIHTEPPDADCIRELMACSILVAKDVVSEALGTEWHGRFAGRRGNSRRIGRHCLLAFLVCAPISFASEL